MERWRVTAEVRLAVTMVVAAECSGEAARLVEQKLRDGAERKGSVVKGFRAVMVGECDDDDNQCLSRP